MKIEMGRQRRTGGRRCSRGPSTPLQPRHTNVAQTQRQPETETCRKAESLDEGEGRSTVVWAEAAESWEMSGVRVDQTSSAMRMSFGSGTPRSEPEPEEASSAVNMEDSHAIIVVGASGDLAKKKTYPALFKLFLNGMLPPAFKVWGYARSASDDASFRDKMREWLEKDAKGDTEKLDAFLGRLVYHQGQYNSPGAPSASFALLLMYLSTQLERRRVRAMRCRGLRQAQRRLDCLGRITGFRRQLTEPGLLSRYSTVSLWPVLHVYQSIGHGAQWLDSCDR